jgi:hypothetical protein
VDGVTPARGLVANPWLLRDIEQDCRAGVVPVRTDADKRRFLSHLIAEADRTQTWRPGFVLEVVRHQFGRDHPLFARLLKADSAAAMLAEMNPTGNVEERDSVSGGYPSGGRSW